MKLVSGSTPYPFVGTQLYSFRIRSTKQGTPKKKYGVCLQVWSKVFLAAEQVEWGFPSGEPSENLDAIEARKPHHVAVSYMSLVYDSAPRGCGKVGLEFWEGSFRLASVSGCLLSGESFQNRALKGSCGSGSLKRFEVSFGSIPGRFSVDMII